MSKPSATKIASGVAAATAAAAVAAAAIAAASTTRPSPATALAGEPMQTYAATTMPLAAAERAAADAVAPERVDLIVKTDEEHAKKGPEGVWHDAFVPARLTARPLQQVTVSIDNYDEAAHSFTSPTMGLDVTIAPGSEKAPRRTTFTFVAPSKAGRYEWFCMFPCDPWAMDHVDYMHGYVTVSA